MGDLKQQWIYIKLYFVLWEKHKCRKAKLSYSFNPKTIFESSKVYKERLKKAKQSIVSSVHTESSIFTSANLSPNKLAARNINIIPVNTNTNCFVFLGAISKL